MMGKQGANEMQRVWTSGDLLVVRIRSLELRSERRNDRLEVYQVSATHRRAFGLIRYDNVSI